MSVSRAHPLQCGAAVILALCSMSCASRGLHFPPSEREAIAELVSRGVPAPLEHADVASTANDATPPALPVEGPVGLADLWDLARRFNPRLAAARSGVGVAAGRALQSSLYPNPTVEVSSEEVPFGPGVLNEGSSVLSITQPIVIGSRLDAGREAARAEQAVTEAEVEVVEREVLGEVALLHNRLVTIRETSRLYASLADLAEQTLASAQARFEARAAPRTEVTKAEIEVYRIRLLRTRLDKEQSAAAVQLSLAIGGAAVDVARLEGSLDTSPRAINLREFESQLRRDHPALRAADREIDAADARLQAMKAERTPDLDVHAGVGYRGESNEPIYELGVGMTLPLWDDRRGEILAGRYALMQARQQRKALETELLSRLAATHGEYEVSRVQLEAVRMQILPAAEQAFEQTTEAYRGGHASFLDVLDAQRTLTEARTTAIEFSGEVAAVRARLFQIVGAADLLIPAVDAPSPERQESLPTEPRHGAED